MRQADLKARIKKIEIANRNLSDGWAQAIRVILDDIELTDENLLELKQFRPNEPVLVLITPLQVSLTEYEDDPFQWTTKQQGLNGNSEINGADDAFQLIEGEPDDLPPGLVEKEWNF